MPHPGRQGRRFSLVEMVMSFMTRGVFDTLIIAIIIIGGALAVVRLYKDLTRPLPGERPQPPVYEDDTQPHQAISDDELPPKEE